MIWRLQWWIWGQISSNQLGPRVWPCPKSPRSISRFCGLVKISAVNISKLSTQQGFRTCLLKRVLIPMESYIIPECREGPTELMKQWHQISACNFPNPALNGNGPDCQRRRVASVGTHPKPETRKGWFGWSPNFIIWGGIINHTRKMMWPTYHTLNI